MSLQQEHPVNHILIADFENGEEMNVTSGRSCLRLYVNTGRCSSFSKMLLQSILVNPFPSSKKYTTIWKMKSTKHCLRLKFRLEVLGPFITETVYGLLPTPMASDGRGGGGSKSRKRQKMNLRDWTKKVLGLQYPPVYMMEEMMGYPHRWTDVEHSEIRLSLK